MKRIIPVFAAFIALVAACNAPQPDKPTPAPEPTPTPTPTPTPEPEPSDGIETLTIGQFKTKKDDATTWYRLNVEIVSISSYQYGYRYGQDASGLLYVYGLAPEKDGSKMDFKNLGLAAGDKITIVAHRKTYNGVDETDGAYFEKKTSGKYPGYSAKKASAKWLELPSTEANDSNTESGPSGQ